jgi:hypothetical protein
MYSEENKQEVEWLSESSGRVEFVRKVMSYITHNKGSVCWIQSGMEIMVNECS